MADWNYNGISDDLRERFWARVRKGRGAKACWEWQGPPARSGYGQLSARCISPHPVLTHRLAWVLTYGEIPEGLYVLHKCDNPVCVRPDHLFLGTQDDNNADRQAKGRTAAGDANGARTHPERNSFIQHGGSRLSRADHPMAKLSEVDVEEIRAAFARMERRVDIANRYGISLTHVYRIARGHSWR